MLVPFESLSDNSRVWIYQANRRLSDAEVTRLESSLKSFCAQWTAHGEPLKTGFRIEHNQFVVLCADEDYHAPSGCSIDTSVRTLKEFQAGIGADFFDRTLVAFLVEGHVAMAKLSELPGKFKSSVLGAATITFNNLTPSKGDFLRSWRVPVEKTWLAKYLGKPALSSQG
jgi:hypothetical protein